MTIEAPPRPKAKRAPGELPKVAVVFSKDGSAQITFDGQPVGDPMGDKSLSNTARLEMPMIVLSVPALVEHLLDDLVVSFVFEGAAKPFETATMQKIRATVAYRDTGRLTTRATRARTDKGRGKVY